KITGKEQGICFFHRRWNGALEASRSEPPPLTHQRFLTFLAPGAYIELCFYNLSDLRGPAFFAGPGKRVRIPRCRATVSEPRMPRTTVPLGTGRGRSRAPVKCPASTRKPGDRRRPYNPIPLAGSGGLPCVSLFFCSCC